VYLGEAYEVEKPYGVAKTDEVYPDEPDEAATNL
jgi:hypothetical protein